MYMSRGRYISLDSGWRSEFGRQQVTISHKKSISLRMVGKVGTLGGSEPVR